MQNSIIKGLLGGLVAAVAAAAVWAAITVITNYQIGFLAIGVGFLVGYAVRVMGKGNTPVFSVMAAGLALLGCALGNLWSAIVFIGKEGGQDAMAAVQGFDYAVSFDVLKLTASPMDFLFYGLAIWQAYKTAQYVAPAEAPVVDTSATPGV